METLENKLQKRIYVLLYALLFLGALLGMSVLLEGCSDTCEVTNEYTYYEPVYTTVEEIRASISLVVPQPIKGVGKIYYKDGILFLNEPGEGIHIIDNSNPANPTPLKFLKVPGNYDLAIKGTTLYADSYVDLVAFDITDINTIQEVGRLEGIFMNYNSLGFSADVNCCVITDWAEKKNVYVAESDCEGYIQPWGGILYEGGIAIRSDLASAFSTKAAIAPGTGSGPGVGGSLARFTLSDDHLYLLDGGDLQTVDVSAERNPVAKQRDFIAWDIETIFPHHDNLFIGSSSGMHILDITVPESPTKVSTYEHIRSCDPVVVDGNYAYVTLRSGNSCQGFTNQLEVIDIEDLTSPKLLRTYPMTNPHGLGIDNQTLFICDGSDGLKAFDISDINTISEHLLVHYKEINATDVIPFNNILMMIGEDGLFQYDYSDPANIKLLSHIEIQNN
ncbi:MAG: hypothetical protein OEV74_13500 [Cyclobacteriaceae bacterium]|nr:hypothetical protein [Cyclobacteriaceae bacterium]MDH4297296.1 hypothetical protein [Cyclobacteriaceae bacterium]MDH5247797.1 hypothetical protein [Cyclobacteriaceae bacterium]